ncbi:MAG TPA: hypothetical protein VFU86_00050 [Terriglobales bacterium]|nr:hypothetical protein [Terriglobales bacterium]
MKKALAALLLAIPITVFAQDQAPAAAAPQAEYVPGTNLTVHQQQPTYSDIYCAGFVSKDHISNANHVLAGLNTPHETRFAGNASGNSYIYLEGPGYVVGNRYSVVRRVEDPDRYESRPGLHKMLKDAGSEYFDIGRVVVTYIDKDVAVGQVEFTCEPMTPGDLLVPFHEKEMVKFREGHAAFARFAPAGGTSGRIIDGKDFDQDLGTGQKVYVNIGANKGIHPGDYLRIVRNYDPSLMLPVDQASLQPPYYSDESKNNVKLTKSDYKKLPWRGVGEMVVLSVTPDTATCMITMALEDVLIGDVVEVEKEQ